MALTDTQQASDIQVSPSEIVDRRVSFSYAEDFTAIWTPLAPEFSCAANSVSLLMPYIEPYFVKSVRRFVPELEGELVDSTQAYLKQEMQHHLAHRDFNDQMADHYRGVPRLERMMRNTINHLHTKRSPEFNLAFAASSETIAYSAARWAAERRTELFGQADPVAASMFLWHLGEEVEHKSAAFDVFKAVGVSKVRYVSAMILSMVLLMFFVATGTTLMLWHERRLFNPVAHVRLWRWAIPFAFEVLTNMVISTTGNHHPTDFADPSFYELWLREYDPDTGTLPLWNAGAEARSPSIPQHQ